jgi:hypothetical protein
VNYSDIKSNFQGLLNRNDVTATQVATWISQGIDRAQRLLVTPASEKVVLVTVASGFTTLAVPGDFLRLIQLSVNGRELTRVEPSVAKYLAQVTGASTVFARDGAQFVIGELPQIGDTIQLNYQSNFSTLSADTDTNWLTDIAPDVILSGAMTFACRHFQDPRLGDFEGQFQQAISDLNLQAANDELTNAAISPAFFT